MSDMGLYAVNLADEGNAVLDIVFIHGLMGSAFDTWTYNGEKDGYWPSWLGASFPNINVWSFEHPAGAVGSIISDDGMTLLQRAKSAVMSFETDGLGARPIIFITHSLGGLLTKKILRISSDSKTSDIHRIYQNTLGVVFLATPHDGSFLSNFTSAIITKLGGKAKNILKELKSGHEPNYELDTWYRDNVADSSIETCVFVETKKLYGMCTIVSEASADPKIPNVMVKPVDEDHLSIAKPTSDRVPLYRNIRAFIQKKIDQSMGDEVSMDELSSDYDYFTTRVRNDRKSLEKKLVDAGRTHEVERAERAKEKAAIRLRKYGLYDSVTKNQIRLLGDIYSRFKNVETLIAAGGANQQIDLELEKSVVKPILIDKGNDQTLNHTRVMDGVYYLTGNCHIKWSVDDET